MKSAKSVLVPVIFKRLTLAAAALATVVLTGSVQAATIHVDFGVSPLGGAPSYTGSTLGTSTGFNFGGGTYQVNQLGAGDQSTLAVGNTVTLTNLFYGPGNSGTLSVDFVKSWTTAAGTFTETLTSFVANRLTPNALTLNLSGILTGPGGISQAAFAVLTANQAAQAINWSFTDTSFSAVATPLPAGFVLFVTGLAGVGLLGRRRRRNAATPAT